jgi:hypothetical protein
VSKDFDLTTLDGGGVIEAVNEELRRVFDNITDVNTRADAPRKLVLTVTFKPGRERNTGTCIYQAVSKLQAAEPRVIPVYVARDRATKKSVALEMMSSDERPDQHRLPGVDNVTELQRKKGDVDA